MLSEEQFKRFKLMRKAGVTVYEAGTALHVARAEVSKANRCNTYEDYCKAAEKRPKKAAPPPPPVWKPGCKHTKTCVYWKQMGATNGALHGCHYPIEVGELRPWPASECPGFKRPLKPKKAAFDFD